MNRFVVAFNRDRDSYQLPWALHEHGRLQKLVTDFYLPQWLASSRLCEFAKVSHRNAAAIPFSSVDWSVRALWDQIIGLRFARTEEERLTIFKRLDSSLSRKAATVAIKNRCDLFLYSGYAKECFEDKRLVDRRKILFVFHPHGSLAASILRADAALYPEVAESHRAHLDEIAKSDGARLEAELQSATDIVCASQFTRNSIKLCGKIVVDPVVVPYGCCLGADPVAKPESGPVNFLFVGQGVQRKGLHHLIRVWRKLRNRDWKLTIVAGKLDPGILDMARGVERVEFLPPLSRKELSRRFLQSHIFIMPSLVEGFGLVYLEALAAGCYVIGGSNTGLPDLGVPEAIGRTVKSGSLSELAEAICEAADLVRNNKALSCEILEFARTREWSKFRDGINQAIG